jgi:hypothetical protein
LITKSREKPILDVGLLNWLAESDKGLASRLFHAELSFHALQRKRLEELNEALKKIDEGVELDFSKFEAEVDHGSREEDEEFISILHKI